MIEIVENETSCKLLHDGQEKLIVEYNYLIEKWVVISTHEGIKFEEKWDYKIEDKELVFDMALRLVNEKAKLLEKNHRKGNASVVGTTILAICLIVKVLLIGVPMVAMVCDLVCFIDCCVMLNLHVLYSLQTRRISYFIASVTWAMCACMYLSMLI